MAEQQPGSQRLRSIKLDLEKRYLQVEATDATILRLRLTPQGIAWELLQPPTITTARAVDRLAEEETPADDKERPQTHTFTGKIKGPVERADLIAMARRRRGPGSLSMKMVMTKPECSQSLFI